MGSGTSTCNQKLDEGLVAAPKKLQSKAIKQSTLNIQFGLSGDINQRRVTATKDELLIEDESDLNNQGSCFVLLRWSQLVNIDDLSDNQLHSFQLLFKDTSHASIYVYCSSKSQKRSWMKLFEQLCPSLLLTKELQSVKRCATNMGFDDSQIECALQTYHNLYGSVYNLHVFAGILSAKYKGTASDSKSSDDEDADLECSVCQSRYTNPVRNIFDQAYCLECITHWFNMIGPEQTKIKDPYTNQPLPQHCRLLIPHFTKLVLVWNADHVHGKRMSDMVVQQVQVLTHGVSSTCMLSL